MTGYGRAVQTFENREITVEIRSVNNRYLDCSVKLPRVFGFAEDSVKAKVKEEISRGKVDVFIGVNVTAGSDMKISLNRPVLEGYLSAMKTIAADYEVKDDISVSSLTRFSDIFVVEKQEEDEQQATQEILTVVSQALEKYAAMRTTEGAALEADLRSRAKTVLELVSKVEARSPVTLAEYRARLDAKNAGGSAEHEHRRGPHFAGGCHLCGQDRRRRRDGSAEKPSGAAGRDADGRRRDRKEA